MRTFFQVRGGGDRGPLDRQDGGMADAPGRCPGLRDGRPLAAERGERCREAVVSVCGWRPLAVECGKRCREAVVSVCGWRPLAVECGKRCREAVVSVCGWQPLAAERGERWREAVVSVCGWRPLAVECGACFPAVPVPVCGWRGVAASVPGLGGLVAPPGRYPSAQGSALGNRGTMMAGRRSANLWL